MENHNKGFIGLIGSRLPFLYLLFPLLFVMSCSGPDSSEPNQEPEPGVQSKPYSKPVGNSNRNMPSGGIITSEFSDSPSGSDISKVVDNDLGTKFVTFHNKFYILWEGNENAAVNRYSLASADEDPTNDPVSWTLSGSNDKDNWNLLDTRVAQTFRERQEVNTYSIDNEKKFKYYRLDIESNNGGDATNISELTLEVYKDTSLPHSVEIDAANVNMPSSGILSAQYSDHPDGSGVDKIVDDNHITNYITEHDIFYILWAGDKEVAVNYYAIRSSNNYPERDPKSWELYASKDEITWTLIDEQSDQTFLQRREERRYILENTTAYKFYRLNVTGNNGGQYTQFSELVFQNMEYGMGDLMQYGHYFPVVADTPMGSHYSNKHMTTEEDRKWLADASNEPSIAEFPEDWHWKEFDVDLYPYGMPVPADVNQRSIGNCGVVAGLAALSYMYPNFVKSIITDNGNRTYTVSMFDPQGKPVKVTVSSEFLVYGSQNNIACVTGKEWNITWATVIEKAILKYITVYKTNGTIGGMGSEHAIPILVGTGAGYAFDPGRLPDGEKLAQAIRASIIDGYIGTGGFNISMIIYDNIPTVTAHAYSLMHSSDPSGLFAMRNPWGGHTNLLGSLDGVINIPSTNEELCKYIDIRFFDPGIAPEVEGHRGTLYPYTPPYFGTRSASMQYPDYYLREIDQGIR